MAEKFEYSAEVTEELAGMRLDKVLVQLCPQFSRARLQTWIKAGQVLVNGEVLRPRDKVYAGAQLEIKAVFEETPEWEAEDIPLDIIYEDEALIVLYKPAGLVVHPAVGNWQGTLLNALINHEPKLADLPRGGIVHRLDKDTSGIMMVARTLESHKQLVDQLQARTVSREYLAVVKGAMTAGATVEKPIGRHPQQRTRMAVVSSGKPAITHYRVVERFPYHTYIRVSLETGRTHQIRVHMAHVRHPVVGDPVYGGRLLIPRGCSELLEMRLRCFRRQALHATKLTIKHPLSGEEVSWEREVPEDMQKLLVDLREDARLRELSS